MLSSLKRSDKLGILKLLEHQCWSNISVTAEMPTFGSLKSPPPPNINNQFFLEIYSQTWKNFWNVYYCVHEKSQSGLRKLNLSMNVN